MIKRKALKYTGENKQEILELFPYLKTTIGSDSKFLHLQSNTYIQPSDYIVYRNLHFIILKESDFFNMFPELT